MDAVVAAAGVAAMAVLGVVDEAALECGEWMRIRGAGGMPLLLLLLLLLLLINEQVARKQRVAGTRAEVGMWLQ